MTDNIFSRSRALLGETAYERLSGAHVVIVGYGAVGSFCAEALARSGLGHLRLIDADIYEASNINRQLGATVGSIGRSKVEMGRAHLLQVNPGLDIEIEERFIDADTMDTVLHEFGDGARPDIVIDAIDTLDAKTDLITAVLRNGTPVLSSMGAARKTKPECIMTADISKTTVCPLAREVRKRLRARGIERGVMCAFSTETARRCPRPDDETGHSRVQKTPLGSLITVTGSFGLRLASECMRMLTEDKTRTDIQATTD